MPKPRLITISGPTASGKTALSIALSKILGADIISFDSRQLYQELHIGVARPTEIELASTPHHFIACKSVQEDYSAQSFVHDVLSLLYDTKFKTRNWVLVGGTGFYLRALLEGLDDLPDISEQIRQQVENEFKQHGLQYLQEQVLEIDPISYKTIDIHNPRRLQRVLELWREHQLIYSEQINKRNQYARIQEDFEVKNIVLDLPRNILYDRINHRVDSMLQDGLIAEVERLYPFRGLNALQTVGYSELFEYLDGKVSLEYAIDKIKQHTRNYAKRQITWNKKYMPDALWVNPQDEEVITKISNYVYS